MTALFGALLAKAFPYLLVSVGGLFAMWTAWVSGRSAGAANERAKQHKARLDDISEAKQIEDAIAGRTDSENRKELGTWSRG